MNKIVQALPVLYFPVDPDSLTSIILRFYEQKCIYA